LGSDAAPGFVIVCTNTARLLYRTTNIIG
jgi:hypothetical protein